MVNRTSGIDALLLTYVEAHAPISIAEVAAGTGFHYETVRRSLNRLQDAGYLRSRRHEMSTPSQWTPA